MVELLVPVLQKRGLMWEDYTVVGGTYRENLLNTPGNSKVPEGHPARKFRYDVLKEKYADEDGNIVIDRREQPKSPEPAVSAPVAEAAKLSVNEKPVATTVEVSA